MEIEMLKSLERCVLVFTETMAPTDNSDKRVRVKVERGKAHVEHWDHALSSLDNHLRAIRKVAKGLGWELITIAAYKDGYAFGISLELSGEIDMDIFEQLKFED